MNREFSGSLGKACQHVFLALSLLFVIAQPSRAEQNIELVFGLYTTDKPTVLVKTFRPILTALENGLSQKLGKAVDIKFHISPSYESGVAALVEGDVDFSRFGPAPYINAVGQNPGLRILALDSKNDQRTNKGVICVTEASAYSDISDLEGARFAFGNRASTVGRYLSQAYLLKHGITIHDLAGFEYLERHDRVGHAVAQGSFDAGALKQSTFNKLKKKGLPLRALATFDNANKPWIARAGLPEELFQVMRTVMFELDDPDAFKLLGQKQFVPGSDSDFDEIRNAINSNNEFFQAKDSVKTATTDDSD